MKLPLVLVAPVITLALLATASAPTTPVKVTDPAGLNTTSASQTVNVN
jgi:hypothetical protein